MITTQQGLTAWIEQLSQCALVAIDTEGDSMHRYGERVCLLQMSTPEQDVLIDPLADLDLQPLAPFLADQHKLKIFHDAGYDLIGLYRDFQLQVRGVFDTMLASRVLGRKQFGLAAILRHYFQFEADKRWQRSDWTQRPLRLEQLAYARYDTHYLPALYPLLRRELEQMDRLHWVDELCAQIPLTCEALVQKRQQQDPKEGFWRIAGVGKLSPAALGRLQQLYWIREQLAANWDRPTFKIARDEVLLRLAIKPVKHLAELQEQLGWRPAMVRRFGAQFLSALQQAKPLHPSTIPAALQRRRGKHWADHAAKKRYESLRQVRRQQATLFNVDPEVLLSNASLEHLASHPPKTLEELVGHPALTGWRSEVLCEPFWQCLSRLIEQVAMPLVSHS